MSLHTHHDESERRPIRTVAIAAGELVGAVVVFAALAEVSWNMFAPELFGLPTLAVREALGLVVFGGVIAFGVRFAFGGGRHG